MHGGLGPDIFAYLSIAETLAVVLNFTMRDHIADFNEGTLFVGDRIDLWAIDANSVIAGNQAFDFIGNNSAFTGDAGELRYNAGFVEGDVNGDSGADFRIRVDSATPLHEYAFVL